MNLANVVISLRSAWSANVANVPLYLQLAPEDASPPFAVLRMGTISKGEDTLGEREFSTGVTMTILTTSDTECLAKMDTVVTTFDRSSIANTTLMILDSTSFDLNYTEAATLWQSDSTFSLRWTTGA
jgi:hypothetical protein